MNHKQQIDALFDELTKLKAQEEKTIDEFRAAQHNLFILSDQDAHPTILEAAMFKAVDFYQAYLDLASEIRVKERRFTDLTD